jgi:hypothetical protein
MDKKYARKILETALERQWSVLGFGKMGTNVSSNAKLHIWDRTLLNPRIPAVHSHSFNLKSFVLAGKVRNMRLLEVEKGEEWNKINVSTAGKPTSDPCKAFLAERVPEVYMEGERYGQSADEVHLSSPDDGTVTLVEWEFCPFPRHMNVYWRGKSPWTDAKPRRATEDEIKSVSKNALEVWF